MYNLFINTGKELGHINPEIQGHFSEHLGRCIYEGVYVGENSSIPNTNGMRNDVVEALKEMKIPVLRWPGGCFADEYHWKDGIGPKETRKKMINTNWGGVTEDNSFGTHEFMELAEQLGCKTYVNGNVGSGTVQEMSEWVEYMTFDGVSHLYKHYQTFVKQFNPDKKIKKLAVGPTDKDYNWTETMLRECFRQQGTYPQNFGYMDGLTLHYYTLPYDWDHKGSATEFNDKEWYMTLSKTFAMEEFIEKHSAIMDRYDPDCRIGLMVDEWGTWYDVEPGTNPGFLYQQNTVRDALIACINLNIFNKHCKRVKMANIAQLVNVLQAVILTEGDKMVKTPTYHVFKMFSCHQDGELLESSLNSEKIGLEDEYMVPNLQESVSKGKDGKVHITLGNLSCTDPYEVSSTLMGASIKSVKASVVGGKMDAYNTFDDPDVVTEKAFDGVKFEGDKLTFTIPASSVMHIEVEI